MKRKLIIGGSLGVVVLLLLAAMPTVVSSNIAKEQRIDQSIYSFNQGELLEKLEQSWIPGSILGSIIILYFIIWTIGSTILKNFWNSFR